MSNGKSANRRLSAGSAVVSETAGSLRLAGRITDNCLLPGQDAATFICADFPDSAGRSLGS